MTIFQYSLLFGITRSVVLNISVVLLWTASNSSPSTELPSVLYQNGCHTVGTSTWLRKVWRPATTNRRGTNIQSIRPTNISTLLVLFTRKNNGISKIISIIVIWIIAIILSWSKMYFEVKLVKLKLKSKGIKIYCRITSSQVIECRKWKHILVLFDI